MASKWIEISYNGERGWDSTIGEVHEFLRIQQPLDEWLDETGPDGLTNRQVILQAYDSSTKVRLGYYEWSDGGDIERTDKDPDVKDIGSGYPMPWPIKLWVTGDKITRDILINQNNAVITGSSAYNFAAPGQGSREDDNFSFTGSLDYWNWWEIERDALTPIETGTFINRIRPYKTYPEIDRSVKTHYRLQVFLWSKAFNELYYLAGSENALGKQRPFNEESIFDLTPFLLSYSQNVVKSGGTFQLNLPLVIGSIACTFDVDDKTTIGSGTWYPDNQYYHKEEIQKYGSKTKDEHFVWKSPLNKPFVFDGDGPDYYNDTPREFAPDTNNQTFQGLRFDDRINLDDEFNSRDISNKLMTPDTIIRTSSFFTNVIAENDIIFVSAIPDNDELTKDRNAYFKASRPNYVNDFWLSVEELAGRDYTMIGLVDTNSTSMNAESTDVTITVTGRDCMKLLLEDGTFFFQKSYANPDQKATAFNNKDLPRQGDDVNALNRVTETQTTEGVNRLITTGMIETLFNQEARNVGFVMSLLMSRLTNIEICPSDVFKYWENKTQFQVEVTENAEDGSDGGTNKDESGLFGDARERREGER